MRTIERFFLGIDVSKGYADFHLMDEHKQMLEKGFQLDDNLPGHQILQNLFSKYTRDGKTLICGIENTGGYEQNWVEMLKKMAKTEAVEVYKLNPKAVKHQIASHLKRTINDGVSAEGIAEYVANNHQQYKENWTNSTYRDPSESSMQQFFRFILAAIKRPDTIRWRSFCIRTFLNHSLFAKTESLAGCCACCVNTLLPVM